MLTRFDHVTIVVRDVEAAKQFFGLLGFKEDKSVVIAGQPFAAYMGVDGIEAEHITLVLANVSPRTEVQLLKYRHPDPLLDPAISNLTKLGFNHVCFAVDNLEAEVARLKAKGVQLRNEIMTSIAESWFFFPDRKASPWNWRNGSEPQLAPNRSLQQTDHAINSSSSFGVVPAARRKERFRPQRSN